MSEFGLAEMTSGEKTWYTILCVLCGAGYFAKLPVAKAISETPPLAASGQGLTYAGRFWYLLGCLAYGANYFAKVCVQEGAVRLRPGPAERHRGNLVHRPVHRVRLRLLRQGPGGQGRQRAAAVQLRRPDSRSRVRELSRRPGLDPAAVGGQGAVATPPPHPAEPVHLWGAVRKGPHAALAQTEERRTRNA